MLTPGESFSSYRVIREIGRGAMGAVFEAEHVSLRKRVAIKVLLPEASSDAAAVQRFLREGEAAARIRHDHIVDVSDVGTRDGTPYLVMEYLDGESLADRLARRRRIDDTELVDLAIPVCDALALAHEAGVVHRDVKPDNIFLARTARGGVRAMLVDFGISHVAHNDPRVARLTSSSVLIGTPCYLSPEAARSARSVDARSDQYAFGVTLYECRTGLLPYERASVFEMLSAILLEDPVPPSMRASDIDPRLEETILRAMSRSPDERFPDMRALALSLLPMASPAVRAKWEPELRDPALSASKRTPVSPIEAIPARPGTTEDELVPLALARTDPGGPLAVAAPPVEASPSSDPAAASPGRRWIAAAALAAAAAVTAAVLALGSAPPAGPSAAVAPSPTPIVLPPSIVLPPPVAAPVVAAPAAPLVVAPVERPRRGASRSARHVDPAPPAPQATAPVVAVAPPAPTAAPPPRSLLRTDFGATTP